MQRNVTKIDVGSHKDKAGFTLYFDSGEKEHFLFALPIAEDLCRKMLKAVEDIRYLQSVLTVPGSTAGVGEEISVKLTDPGEVEESGEEKEEK